jgi:hypothetical protein
LREDEDAAAVYEAVAGDDAVAGVELTVEPEVARAVYDELVELLEGAIVQKEFDALARSPLAGLVLSLDARAAAALLRAALPCEELVELRLVCVFCRFGFHGLWRLVTFGGGL